jgi:hypothetical protein
MKWLVGLAIASGTPARADDRAVMADVPAGAPFDAAELAAAIRLRVPPGGAAIRIRVVPTPDGVRIEARGNARDVALRGSTGAAAARLVALAASDLLLDDLAAAPELPAAARPAGAAVTIGALAGVAAWHYTLASLGVDVAVGRDSWLLAIEAGGGTLIDGPLHLTAGVLRLGCGTRFGAFELRAGATLVPLSVANGTGDATVLAGGGASARLHATLSANVRGVLVGGVDVFATRTTYELDGMSVLATPRSALWLGAGLEVTP